MKFENLKKSEDETTNNIVAGLHWLNTTSLAMEDRVGYDHAHPHRPSIYHSSLIIQESAGYLSEKGNFEPMVKKNVSALLPWDIWT